MFFLVRSVFWLAIVAAFMPAGSIGSTPYLDEAAMSKAETIGVVAFDKIGAKVRSAALELCIENPSTCAEGAAFAANATATATMLATDVTGSIVKHSN